MTAINAAMPANTILASSPSAGVLRLTAELPGAPFDLDYGFGPGVDTGVWAHTTNRSALTDLDQAILGLAQYTAVREHLVREPTQGVHPPASPLNVRHDGGKLFVASEDAPAGSSRVYVRIAANGSLDQLGAVRATPNAGCVLSRRLRWHKHYPAEVSGGVFLAVVQID